MNKSIVHNLHFVSSLSTCDENAQTLVHGLEVQFTRKQFLQNFSIDIAYILTNLTINAGAENLQYPLYKINDPAITLHLTTICKKWKP